MPWGSGSLGFDGNLGQEIAVVSKPMGIETTLLSLCGSDLIPGPPVFGLCLLAEARGQLAVCPREVPGPCVFSSLGLGLGEDTWGGGLGRLGEPGQDRGGTVLPAKVISHPHLHPTRLLASVRTLMD